MASMRIPLLFFLIAACGIAGILVWKSRPASLCGKLRCIRMDTLSSFVKQDLYSDTENTYRALFTSGRRFLRIEAQKTAPLASDAELNAAITKVKAMYEKAPAPYPGEISDAIICDPSFIPTYEEIKQDDTKTAIFVGYLNNRMTFGSCSQDQAVYRGILALTYCRKQSLLLRLELIAPTDTFRENENELMNQIRSLRCAD